MSTDLTSSDGANLAYLLLSRHRWILRGLHQRLQDVRRLPELGISQMLLMASVDAEGTPLAELARRLGTSRQAVHQAVQGLVRLDLVELVADAQDRRTRRARLTAKGRRIDRKVVATIHELERELEARLGAKAVAAMRAVLEMDWGEPG